MSHALGSGAACARAANRQDITVAAPVKRRSPPSVEDLRGTARRADHDDMEVLELTGIRNKCRKRSHLWLSRPDTAPLGLLCSGQGPSLNLGRLNFL